jgi:uncharacterized protein (TIGR04255 family)
MSSREREIYGKPSIIEAVIDIRCVSRTGLTLRELATLSNRLGDDVTRSELVEVTTEFDSDDERTTRRVVGHVFKFNNQLSVAQARVNGLAVARLHPYEKWELFLDQVTSTWRRYYDIASPSAITRVGVRYINSLPIGDPGVEELAPFLRLRPVTPWKLTSPPAAFFLQIRRLLDERSVLVVNEATILDPTSGKASILLDLDASREETFPYNEEQMWNLVEELHVQLREAFENAIDDSVREILR